jgi:hypothetical protein
MCLDALLEEVQKGCDQLAGPSFWGVSRRHSFTGRLDPSVVYYQAVLCIWTDDFGGSLRLSRSSERSNKVYGPLLRFFFAVVGPVMGKRTPSHQSLHDIVARQKEFRDWLIASDQLLATHDWDRYIADCDQRWPEIARQARVMKLVAGSPPRIEK